MRFSFSTALATESPGQPVEPPSRNVVNQSTSQPCLPVNRAEAVDSITITRALISYRSGSKGTANRKSNYNIEGLQYETKIRPPTCVANLPPQSQCFKAGTRRPLSKRTSYPVNRTLFAS